MNEKSFGKCTLEFLDTEFSLMQVNSLPLLEDWVNVSSDVTEIEKINLLDLQLEERPFRLEAYCCLPGGESYRSDQVGIRLEVGEGESFDHLLFRCRRIRSTPNQPDHSIQVSQGN